MAFTECKACSLWLPISNERGSLVGGYGICTIKLPPWVADASRQGHQLTERDQGCGFGNPRPVSSATPISRQ